MRAASGGPSLNRWHGAASNDNPNGGNVGLGTSSPASALHVAGATGVTLGEDKTAGTANTASSLKLISAGDNAFGTAFTAGTQTADVTYTLPTAAPDTNGKVLSATTAGVLSWAASGGTGTVTVAAVRVSRIGGDAGDTMTALAELVMVKIEWTASAESDSPDGFWILDFRFWILDLEIENQKSKI